MLFSISVPRLISILSVCVLPTFTSVFYSLSLTYFYLWILFSLSYLHLPLYSILSLSVYTFTSVFYSLSICIFIHLCILFSLYLYLHSSLYYIISYICIYIHLCILLSLCLYLHSSLYYLPNRLCDSVNHYVWFCLWDFSSYNDLFDFISTYIYLSVLTSMPVFGVDLLKANVFTCFFNLSLSLWLLILPWSSIYSIM